MTVFFTHVFIMISAFIVIMLDFFNISVLVNTTVLWKSLFLSLSLSYFGRSLSGLPLHFKDCCVALFYICYGKELIGLVFVFCWSVADVETVSYTCGCMHRPSL